ncbi:MAG: multicopper oxidase domain-containing protein [Nitrospira sp.]|nr:multicopper oxidase domain-containing protein [Nitrospira sp.]
MKARLLGSFFKIVNVNSWKTYLVGVLALTLCLSGNESAQATTGVGPYEVPQVLDADNDPSNGIETWIVADEATVDIGNGVTANGMAYKSCSDKQLHHCTTPGIPGPEFRLKVGDRVIVHFVNNLERSGLDPEANVSGIHWHGIELNNQSDGTELTQSAVDPKGGKFNYDFTVSRPGIFWYHPHHHSSTNQVAKGLYGSIIIKDKNGYEAALQGNNPSVDGVVSSADHTKTLVLSDITVCNTPGSNPPTFDGNLPHVSGIQAWEINYQNHPLTQSPLILCEAYPLDANGVYTPNLYRVGDVPNIQSPSLTGRMGEGFTVLTNGVQVSGRSLSIDPMTGAWTVGALSSGASTLDVQADQGLRLQIVNPSPVRYMRLRLTTSNGAQVNLFRIGGEGGLLNRAVLEGGTVGEFDFKYGQGEILLPPAGRADVVAKIPSIGTTSDTVAEGSVLTLWTEDFQRVAATYSWTPTVPVMHLKVNGSTATPYTIANGSHLLESLGTNAMVKVLDAATGNLILGSGEQGSLNKDIQLTFWANNGAFEASVDGVPMPREFTGLGKDGLANGGNPFFLQSARHAALANTMELTVTNTTGAHHPFHLHGFSVQPIGLAPRPGTTGPSYNFPYYEFRDIVDVPANYTLTFRVSLADRPTTNKSQGGGLGRWMFHCHILPHATFGMRSELHVH